MCHIVAFKIKIVIEWNKNLTNFYISLFVAGDRIQSLTISFKNMVYEDALTILSYASPYPVIVELERTSPQNIEDVETPRDDQSLVLTHPIYRSQSDADLSKIANKQDPETMMFKIRRIRSEMKRSSGKRRGSHDDGESQEGTLRKWRGKENIVLSDESRTEDSSLNVTDVNMDADALLAQVDLNRQSRDVTIGKDGDVKYKRDIVDVDRDVVLKVDEPRRGVTINDDTKVVIHTSGSDKRLKRKSESDDETPPALPESPPPMKRSREASQESLTDKDFVDYHKLPTEDKLEVLRASYDGPASFDDEDVNIEKKQRTVIVPGGKTVHYNYEGPDIDTSEREINVHTKTAAPGLVVGTGLASQGDEKTVKYEYKGVDVESSNLEVGTLEYEGPDRDSRELKSKTSSLEALRQSYEGPHSKGQEITVTTENVIPGVRVGSGDARIETQHYEVDDPEGKTRVVTKRYQVEGPDGETRTEVLNYKMDDGDRDVTIRTREIVTPGMAVGGKTTTQRVEIDSPDVRISGDGTRYITTDSGQVQIDQDSPNVKVTSQRRVGYEIHKNDKLEELNSHYETPDMAQEETVVTKVIKQSKDIDSKDVRIPGDDNGYITATTTKQVVIDSEPGVQIADRSKIVEYELQGTEKLEELNANYETPEMAQEETTVTTVSRPGVNVRIDGEVEGKKVEIKGRDVVTGDTKRTVVVKTPEGHIDKSRIVQYELRGTDKLEELNTHYETPEMAQEETAITTVTRPGSVGQTQESIGVNNRFIGIEDSTRTERIITVDSKHADKTAKGSVDKSRIVEYELHGTDKLEELNAHYETSEMAQEDTVSTVRPASEGQTQERTVVIPGGQIEERRRGVKDRDGVTTRTVVVETPGSNVDKSRIVGYELHGTDKLEELNAYYETPEMAQEETVITTVKRPRGESQTRERTVVIPGDKTEERKVDRDVVMDGDASGNTQRTVIVDTPEGSADKSRIVEYELHGTDKLEELNAHYETPDMAQEETVITTVKRPRGQGQTQERTVFIPGATVGQTQENIGVNNRYTVIEDPTRTERIITVDSKDADKTSYDLQVTPKLEELNTYYETPEMAQEETIVTSITRPEADVQTKIRDRTLIISDGTTKTTTTTTVIGQDTSTQDAEFDKSRIVEYKLQGTNKLEELNDNYETPRMAQGESIVTSVTWDPDHDTSTRVVTSRVDVDQPTDKTTPAKTKHKSKKDVLSIETVKRGLVDIKIKGTEKLEELNTHYEHAGMTQPDLDSTDFHVRYSDAGQSLNNQTRHIGGSVTVPGRGLTQTTVETREGDIIVPGREKDVVIERRVITSDNNEISFNSSADDTLEALRVNYEGPDSPKMEEDVIFQQRDEKIDPNELVSPGYDGTTRDVHIDSDKSRDGRTIVTTRGETTRTTRKVIVESDTPNIALEKLRTTYEGPEYEMSEDVPDRSHHTQQVIVGRPDVETDNRETRTITYTDESNRRITTDRDVKTPRYWEVLTGDGSLSTDSKLEELDRHYEGREYTMSQDVPDYDQQRVSVTQPDVNITRYSRTSKHEEGLSPDRGRTRRYEGGISPDRDRQRVVISSSTPARSVSGRDKLDELRTQYETSTMDADLTEREDRTRVSLEEYDRIVRTGEERDYPNSQIENLRLKYSTAPDLPESQTRIVTRRVRGVDDRPDHTTQSGGYSVVSNVTSKIKADAKAEYEQYRIRRGSGSSFEEEFEENKRLQQRIGSDGDDVPFCPDGLTDTNLTERDRNTEQKVETVYIMKDGRIRSAESDSLVGIDVDPDKSFEEEVIVRGGGVDLGVPGDRSTTTKTTTTRVIRREHSGDHGEPDVEQDSFNSSMRVNVDDSILRRREPADSPSTEENRNSSKYLEDEKVQAVLADYFADTPSLASKFGVGAKKKDEDSPVIERSQRLIKYEHSDSDHSDDTGMSNLKQQLYQRIEAETPETHRTVVTRTTTREESIPSLQGHHEISSRQFDTMSTESAPEPRSRIEAEERSSKSRAADLESSSRKRSRSREKLSGGGMAYFVSIDKNFPKGPAIEVPSRTSGEDIDRPSLVRSSGQHDLATTETRSVVSRYSTDTSSSNHVKDDLSEGDRKGSRVVTERTVIRTTSRDEPKVAVDKNDNETEIVQGPHGTYTMTVTSSKRSGHSPGFHVFRDDSDA